MVPGNITDLGNRGAASSGLVRGRGPRKPPQGLSILGHAASTNQNQEAATAAVETFHAYKICTGPKYRYLCPSLDTVKLYWNTGRPPQHPMAALSNRNHRAAEAWPLMSFCLQISYEVHLIILLSRLFIGILVTKIIRMTPYDNMVEMSLVGLQNWIFICELLAA